MPTWPPPCLSQDPNVADVKPTNNHMEVSLKDGITDFSFIPNG